MRYRTLGNSGCSVSELCLGTMTFGAETDEEGSHAQLDRFVEAGGTRAVITRLDHIVDAITGDGGTVVVPDQGEN